MEFFILRLIHAQTRTAAREPFKRSLILWDERGAAPILFDKGVFAYGAEFRGSGGSKFCSAELFIRNACSSHGVFPYAGMGNHL